MISGRQLFDSIKRNSLLFSMIVGAAGYLFTQVDSLIPIGDAIAPVIHFIIGRSIGYAWGDSISAGQALSQKNIIM